MSSFENASSSNRTKLPKAKGNPIEMPTVDSFENSSNKSKGRSSLASPYSRIGRNTLDQPRVSSSSSSSPLTSTRSRNSFEAPSNVSPVNRRAPTSLESLTGGVPQKGAQRFGLRLQSSPSSKNAIEPRPQYRNANERSREDAERFPSSFTSSSFMIPEFKAKTRSQARAAQNEIPIEILDSEESEDDSREDGPSTSLAEQEDIVIHPSPATKAVKESSPLSSDSNTTLSEEKVEKSHTAGKGDEMNLDKVIPLNSFVDHARANDGIRQRVSLSPSDGRTNIEQGNSDLRRFGERHTNRIQSDHRAVPETAKSFTIMQPLDSTKLGNTMASRMKGRDGKPPPAKNTVQSFLPRKGPSHMYNSGLQKDSNTFSAKPRSEINETKRTRQPSSVRLHKFSFLSIGSIESQHKPIAEFKELENLTLRFEEGANAEGPTELVLDIADLDEMAASPVSASPGPKDIFRSLSFSIPQGSETFDKVCEILEKHKGVGSVDTRRPFRLFLDVGRSMDRQVETDWINFREKIRCFANREMKNLSPREIEVLERLMRETPDLFEPEVEKAKPSVTERPKPKPTVSKVPLSSFTSKAEISTIGASKSAIEKRDKEERTSTTQSQPKESIKENPKKRSISPRMDESPTRLIYPIRGSGCVQVLQSDVDKLDEGEFLNDTIIEFGLKYLLEQIKERDAELYSEIFVFNSFFYTRFNERKKDPDRGYSTVKRWTRGTDIFKKKYIVMPINENLHWYLAIICNPLLAIPEEYRVEGDSEQSSNLQDNGVDDEDAGARRSPESGPDGQDDQEGNTTSHDSLFGEGPPLHQSNVNLDSDGDLQMQNATSSFSLPVKDKRSEPLSDAITNHGGGKMVGGGDISGKRKGLGTLIKPGDCFRDEEREGDDIEIGQVKRNRPGMSTRQSQRIQSLSPEIQKRDLPKGSAPISTSNFYSSSTSPQSTRQLRSRGPANTTDVMMMDSSRRSSLSSPESLSDKWRDQLLNSATVCVFDSLQSRHPSVKTAMKYYLAYEYADKRNIKPFEGKEVELFPIEVSMVRQPNYCDCGLYLLHAFERFFSDPQKFKTEVIPSKDMKHAAWNAKEALNLRKSWKEIIEGLAKEWQTERDRRLMERQKEGKKGDLKEEEEEDDGDHEEGGKSVNK